jgi:hypothetical protein
VEQRDHHTTPAATMQTAMPEIQSYGIDLEKDSKPLVANGGTSPTSMMSADVCS